MTKLKKIAGEKLLKDKAFRTWYDGQSKEYLKKLYNTTKNKNVKKALLRLNNDAVRAARKATVQSAGKFLGGKALGVLGFMGAGTLSASATPRRRFTKQNVDFKAINEDLAKAMYKPLTKKKKGGKKYRDGGFKATFLEPGIENID